MAPPKIGTIEEIPQDKDVNVRQVTWKKGYCDRVGCKRIYTHLHEHYLKCHVRTPKSRPTGIIKVLTPGLTVDPQLVSGRPGRCNICKKDIKLNLRTHYKTVHRKITIVCKECGSAISCAGFNQHLKEAHTGPRKCSKCDHISPSLEAFRTHRKRKHKGVTEVEAIPLTTAELKDYGYLKVGRQERRAQEAVRRTHIDKLRGKLENYEIRLKIRGDVLHRRAQELQARFNSLFTFNPETKIISVNASFISVWNPDWKLPSLVFEVLAKKSDAHTYYSSNFFADPKAGTLTQPTTQDYSGSGYERGHLVSASDFDEVDMVMPTYYYTNVVPMTFEVNHYARSLLEEYIRNMADEYELVMAIHFPVMDRTKTEIGHANKVRVPPFIGTVVMTSQTDGYHIRAWELQNTPHYYDFETCRRDPFALMNKVGLPFTPGQEAIIVDAFYAEA